jgi:hypothetical protein
MMASNRLARVVATLVRLDMIAGIALAVALLAYGPSFIVR